MNWAKQNKFLAGLLVVVLLAGGALGYLLFTAKGSADEASAKYEETANELKRLESLPIHPDGKNLKALELQRTEHQERTDSLFETLAGMAPTLETVSPEQFQDRLRETVTAFVKDAGAAGMALPKPFYMGFDTYAATPPRAEAAPYLARTLKAIDFTLRQLLNARVTELRELDREPLPEEAGVAAKAAPASGKPSKAGTSASGSELIKKRLFQITYFGEQIATQKVLNALSGERKWFIIPRSIIVKNEKPTGPPRTDAAALPPPAAPDGAPAAPAAPVAPASGAPAVPGAKAFEFIVGEEKIETTMLVEFSIFNQAANVKTGAAKPKALK